MKNVCQCCGQTIKAIKTAVSVEPIDTLTLSTADVYAYFKKTAPIEDAKFFLRDNSLLTPEQISEVEALIARPPARTEFYRRLRNVQDAWRVLAMARARNERIAAAAVEEAA